MLNLALFDLIDMNKLIQRKNALKLSSDCELFSIDMTRILELLPNKEFTQCVLECDPKKKSSEMLFDFKED